MQKPTTGEISGTALDRIKTDFAGLWDAATLLLGTGQCGLFPTWLFPHLGETGKSWKQAGKCLG